METRTPYRIVVAGTKLCKGKSYKRYSQIVPRDYAYIAWNPVQSYQEARLPGAGSFLYTGIFAVRRAALEFLTLPETRQVQIRTNQDKAIYRFWKEADGSIRGGSCGD